MKEMTLSGWAGGPVDYKLGLEYYHGKDVVHQGCLLELDADASWEKISPKIRNKIRQAQKLNIDIRQVAGTAEDIRLFRTIWFDPGDETIPEILDPDEIMYLAYDGNELLGGLILTPSGNSLYMHNLGASPEGKRMNIPALLLWHAVEELSTSRYRYIDVGVSFRSNLYSFFKQWQTESYPIIFEAPFIRPDIRLVPFEGKDVPIYRGENTGGVSEAILQSFGSECTILPRAIAAIRALLLHLEVRPEQNVAIYKTFHNDYISRCVTDPIESICHASRKIDDATAAAIVIHEFGHPCAQIRSLKAECEARGIPLIEDCAWTYGTRLDDTAKVGEVGDFAIFSLPKICSLPYGAILTGIAISDDELWNKYGLLDYYKRETIVSALGNLLPTLADAGERRRSNWQYLARCFEQSGCAPIAPIDEGCHPGAFLVRLPDYLDAFDRYQNFGVEAGRYYHEQALYLPVHQNLTDTELSYIYAVYRGQQNLCIDYRRER
jgi:perosamine synthetase